MDNSYNENAKDAKNKIMQAILEKCDFYYDDDLLSEETVIVEYLKFLARQFNPEEKTISFAFHTGSKCFDMVALPALLIGSLFYEFSSNEDILRNLEIGDMVLYKNRKGEKKRYRFKGIKFDNDREVIGLEEDVKNASPCTTWYPFEQNKHLITPYNGESEKTGGQGVKKSSEFREDFLSYVLDKPINDIPTTMNYSVVVVAQKYYIKELCEHIKIVYCDKTVKLSDIVPVTYYTKGLEGTQIGENPSKAEAVIKVVGDISTAREIVLSNKKYFDNEIKGIMLINAMPQDDNNSELDIFDKTFIKFAIINEPLNFKLCKWAMDNFEGANFFACTRDYLEQFENAIYCNEDLDIKIRNIICHYVSLSSLPDCLSYDDYKDIKNKLNEIKKDSDFKDNIEFYNLAWELILLFSKSFLKISDLEKWISKIVLDIRSPLASLNKLYDISNNLPENSYIRKQTERVGISLLKMYYSLYDNSPKETELIKLFSQYSHDKIALVVPKKDFVKIFYTEFQNKYTNVECIYINDLNRTDKYDFIILLGFFRKFNIFNCFSAPDIILLCYDFEEQLFLKQEEWVERIENKLNEKIKNLY